MPLPLVPSRPDGEIEDQDRRPAGAARHPYRSRGFGCDKGGGEETFLGAACRIGKRPKRQSRGGVDGIGSWREPDGRSCGQVSDAMVLGECPLGSGAYTGLSLVYALCVCPGRMEKGGSDVHSEPPSLL